MHSACLLSLTRTMWGFFNTPLRCPKNHYEAMFVEMWLQRNTGFWGRWEGPGAEVSALQPPLCDKRWHFILVIPKRSPLQARNKVARVENRAATIESQCIPKNWWHSVCTTEDKDSESVQEYGGPTWNTSDCLISDILDIKLPVFFGRAVFWTHKLFCKSSGAKKHECWNQSQGNDWPLFLWMFWNHVLSQVYNWLEKGSKML